MVVKLLNDRVAHRRLARRGASTHAYDEGLPGPVLRLGEREPRRGDERAVAAGGAGGGGGRGEGEAARVETEAAEVGTHRGAQRVLHRLYGGGCRLAGHLGDRLGGFDTGRRWGFWVGEPITNRNSNAKIFVHLSFKTNTISLITIGFLELLVLDLTTIYGQRMLQLLYCMIHIMSH